MSRDRRPGRMLRGRINPTFMSPHGERPPRPQEVLYLKEAEAEARRLLAAGVPKAEVRRRILAREL